MVKKRNRRTRRVFFVIMACFFTTACLMTYEINSYINIPVLMSMLSSKPSVSKSQKVFYGENIDMSQILPTSQRYVVNSKGQDLIDIAASLGINIIRITNIQRSVNNGADSIYTKRQWDKVLNKMQRKGMKAIILIEVASSNENYYNRKIQPVYLHLVQEYIDSGVFSNPDVYAVDIKNEPLLTDVNIKVLQKAHSMIKAKYPNLKVTIGFWATPKSYSGDIYSLSNYVWSDFSTGQKISSIVDFYSIHMYGFDTDYLGMHLSPDLKTKVFLSEVENGLKTRKPILIEEFGEANGYAVSDQDTIGSPQLQANVYEGVYQALKEIHSSQIIGAVAFDFYSRDQYPDAWDIIMNNGNYLLPAASILKEYATGKIDPALQKTTAVTSQSYLVTNIDNNTIRNMHISDRIALKLQLDHSLNYSLAISTPNVLKVIQRLYYYPTTASFYAVYQAVGKGTIRLTVFSSDVFKENTISTFPEYSLTIIVQ